ncbi:MAG TPA: cation diffusion facilitator family transporter [Candidatus Eisenbacteria bacterium]|nr:cation diffusion facilitator family transporter [Candidatus Eisenbacteria bacterium]
MNAGAASGGLHPWQRAREISFVLWVVLGLNWAVALCKLLIGHWTNSTTIFADGLHSFSDGTSNIIGLVGISIARHPADLDHPYGHEKYETLAATVIGFLLLFVSGRIYWEALQSFLGARPPVQITALSFAVMGATLAVNLFVVWYERRRAVALNSELLKADSWHTLTDVWVTLSVLAALVGIRLGIPYVDSLFAMGIATVIVFTALGLLKVSSDILCDKAPLEPVCIERIVRRVEGVRDCHEIRTRGKPDAVYVDLHVLVDNEMTVSASHRLANLIERDIRRELSVVHDVVVHIEPVSHGHDEI